MASDLTPRDVQQLRTHLQNGSVFRDVDARELRVLPSWLKGADPFKLQRQVGRFGAESVAMPPLIVYEAADGVLVVYNAVPVRPESPNLPQARWSGPR